MPKSVSSSKKQRAVTSAPTSKGPKANGKSVPQKQVDTLLRAGKPGARKDSSSSSLTAHATDAGFVPLSYAKSLIRAIPDFPKKGILFRDITPLLASARGFHAVTDAFVARFVNEPISAIVAIESRGFIFGAALAARLNVSFVPVRKPGKLPAATDRVSYSLEYGKAELEMHRDALRSGSRVVVIDDLLATGGTALAAGELVKRQGAEVAAYAFVIELASLNGRKVLSPVPVVPLLQF